MGNKKKFLAFFRLFAITCYYNYFCDEMTQVHGTIYIVDITGHTMANEMKVSLEDKRKFTVIMQVSPNRYPLLLFILQDMAHEINLIVCTGLKTQFYPL